jgi:hypothetical protein
MEGLGYLSLPLNRQAGFFRKTQPGRYRPLAAITTAKAILLTPYVVLNV